MSLFLYIRFLKFVTVFLVGGLEHHANKEGEDGKESKDAHGQRIIVEIGLHAVNDVTPHDAILI